MRTDSFEGLHVLLVTEDDARAQAIARSLRERKAHVGDVRAGSKDPVALRGADLLVIDSRRSPTTEARIAEVRNDVRARWASVATIDYASIASSDGTVDLRALEGIVSRLAGMDKALTERARKEQTFETLLAPLGPTRTLRALAMAGPTLHVELREDGLKATLDLADELLVAAFADKKGERSEAWMALARVLGMSDATVTVTRRAHPSAMNIMEPVDQALEAAAQERARAPQLFDDERPEELSGLHREKAFATPPAAAAQPAAAPSAPAQPAQPAQVAQPAEPAAQSASGISPVQTAVASAAAAPAQAAGARAAGSAPMPPRARTLAGVPPVVMPPPPPPASLRPPIPPPPAPSRPSSPRPSTPREPFADLPTDPAAPGLLQRMARSPANDATPATVKTVESSPPKIDMPTPVPEHPPDPEALDAAAFEGDNEGEDYDAGEVTVVADSAQLDMLRETLERFDEQKRPLTSTMPAPPGPTSGELENVAALKPAEPSIVIEPQVADRNSKPSWKPAGPTQSVTAPISVPPGVAAGSPRAPRTQSLPAPKKSRAWLAIAVVLVVALAVAAVLLSRARGTGEGARNPPPVPGSSEGTGP